MLMVGGTLAITEIDAAEDAFVAISIEGAYGSLTINADGIWSYSADNNQTVIQNLASGASLSERITISSIDGTQHTLVITINGTDDASAPITITDPVEPIHISLAWTPPSAREDNITPLSLSEIAGYNIYYGNAQGQYPKTVNIADGTADSYIFTDLPTGTYYFVVTTYDTDGRESQYSPVVISWLIP
jgi:VCBS repeat-containing protein